MRVVFSFLMTLFLTPFLGLAQPDGDGEPTGKLIECGTKDNSTLFWMGNDFSNADYTLLPPGSDAYDGNDLLYRFVLTEESDVRLTITSDCPKGTFLFAQNAAGELINIDYSEMRRAKKDFLGAVRLYPGTYFFVIDEPTNVDCNDFMVTLECIPFEPYKVCEFGGDITTCGKNITDTIPKPRERIIPYGLPPNPEENPQIAEDGECPPMGFKVYKAYFRNPQQIVATLSNQVGNTTVQIMDENCACLVDAYCFEGNCSSVANSKKTIFNNAIEGFYYILVKGDTDATYDLEVQTKDCDCDYQQTDIECGETVSVNIQGYSNDFFNNPNSGVQDYRNCYSGNRNYNGGDVIYLLNIPATTEVTIELTSFFDAGLFLFDANCKTDCIAYDQTVGINGSASISDFTLGCGLYQIVVDLASPHPASIDCPIELRVTSCVETPLYIQDTEPLGDIINTVRLDPDILFEKHNNSNNNTNNNNLKEIEDESLMSFFSTNDKCENAPNSAITYNVTPNNETDLQGQLKERPKNIYTITELIKAKHQTKEESNDPDGGFLFIDLIFDEEPDERFRRSEIGVLLEISSNLADPRPREQKNIQELNRIIPVGGATIEFEVYANESGNVIAREREIWCIQEFTPNSSGIDIETPLPLTGRGTEKVQLTFGPNTTGEPQSAVLKLSSVNALDKAVILEIYQDCSSTPTIGNREPTIDGCPIDTIHIHQLIEGRAAITEALKDSIGEGLVFTDTCGMIVDTLILDNPFVIENGQEVLPNGQTTHIKWAVEDDMGARKYCIVKVKVDIRTTFFDDYPWVTDNPINFTQESCNNGESITIYQHDRYQYAYVLPRGDLYYYYSGIQNARQLCGLPDDCVNNHPNNLVGKEIASYSCQQPRLGLLPLGVPLFEKELEVTIYPNPNNGNFMVSFNGIETESSPKDLVVYNLYGKIVQSIKLPNLNNNQHLQIDLGDVANGIYYLHFQSANTKAIKKVIVQN